MTRTTSTTTTITPGGYCEARKGVFTAQQLNCTDMQLREHTHTHTRQTETAVARPQTQTVGKHGQKQ